MRKSSITIITILLFVQILSHGFAQLPPVDDREELETIVEFPSLTSARNNSTGNGTGGNGNNTGGNNTGGNNTGGNNTGGNNTGGNNTGSNNDSHCLTIDNFTISSTYFVTINLNNICNFSLNYPGINVTADNSGVSGYYGQTNWWYMIGANNTTTLSFQLLFNSSVLNGTNITLDFEAAILNCGTNGAWHDCPNSNNSTLSYQFQYTPPPTRLIISSLSLNSQNDIIIVRYYSQNYTGYVNWVFDSSNGTSSSNSYSNSYVRTTYIYPSTFGMIQICGTIDNSVTECVSINRTSRVVEGYLILPSNNTSQNGAYLSISYFANNYSNGTITLNGNNYRTLGSYFYEDNDENSSSNNSEWNNSNNLTIYIPYGISTICLELTGEDNSHLSDCISVERIVSPHSVLITYPATGTSFTGQYLNLSYALENSSSHHFTIDGTVIYPNANNSNYVQLNVGFGTSTVCVVSYDYAYTAFSDCIIVNMTDPNVDTDADGISDHSDLCANTTSGSAVDSDGCASNQLDNDVDGVTDNLDMCPYTQQFSNVDSIGCAAYQRDTDGDGVNDNLDSCPSTAANSVVNSYGCANSQTDLDNDGVMDDLDLCPSTLVGSQVDANGCASSQLDSDGDGIVDSFDRCPNTGAGTVVDQTGCAYSSSNGNSTTNNGSSNSGSTSDDSSSLPSLGIAGTITAISLGFIITTRRENEE